MDDRTYFAQLPSQEGSDEFIAVIHGTTGYNKTNVYDQAHATVLNERQNITPAMVEAAVTCSMFDNWGAFDYMVETFDRVSN